MALGRENLWKAGMQAETGDGELRSGSWGSRVNKGTGTSRGWEEVGGKMWDAHQACAQAVLPGKTVPV